MIKIEIRVKKIAVVTGMAGVMTLALHAQEVGQKAVTDGAEFNWWRLAVPGLMVLLVWVHRYVLHGHSSGAEDRMQKYLDDTGPDEKELEVDENESPEMTPLVAWLCEEASKQTGIQIDQEPLAVRRITEAAKQAQASLAQEAETEISLPFLAATNAGPQNFRLRVSRSDFERF